MPGDGRDHFAAGSLKATGSVVDDRFARAADRQNCFDKGPGRTSSCAGSNDAMARMPSEPHTSRFAARPKPPP